MDTGTLRRPTLMKMCGQSDVLWHDVAGAGVESGCVPGLFARHSQWKIPIRLPPGSQGGNGCWSSQPGQRENEQLGNELLVVSDVPPRFGQTDRHRAVSLFRDGLEVATRSEPILQSRIWY